MFPSSTTTQLDSDVLRQARAFILRHFNEQADNRLVFHNYHLTVRLATATHIIGTAEGLDEHLLEAALLAAWFCHAGYAINYEQHREESVRIADRFLSDHDYPTERVVRCLRNVDGMQTRYREARVLSDAVNALSFGENFEEASPLLRLELELMLHQKFSSQDWAQFQLQQLLNANFQTDYGQQTFGPVIGQNILRQKEILDQERRRDERNAALQPGLFQKLERKQPTSAAQTFFRTNYRNHINLSAIADQKANIMISVNAILVSVIITVLTYQNITETRPAILLPAIIFMVTGLSSLICAVLSAVPKVTKLNEGERSTEEIRRNITYFGNFVHLELEQYEQAMDAVLRNGELLYGNMTRDLYYLGKVLDKKYRYLTMSYAIFLVGFVATVITFLFVFLY